MGEITVTNRKLDDDERAWVKAIVQEVMEVHMLSCPYGREVTKIKWMMSGAIIVGVLLGIIGTDIGTAIKGFLGI